MEQQRQAVLDHAYRMIQLIGATFIASLLVYVVIVEFVLLRGEPADAAAARMLRYLAAVLVIGSLFVVPVIQKLFLRVNGGHGKRRPGAGFADPAVGNLLSLSVMTFAFCEAPAVLGVVLTVLSGKRLDFYAFLLLSAVMFAVFFPRHAQCERWYDQLAGNPSEGE